MPCSSSYQNIDELKNKMRQDFLKKRQSLNDEVRQEKNDKIKENFFSIFNLGTHLIIAGYMPILGEVDCIPLLQQLYKEKCKIVIPIVEEHNQSLRFCLWEPDMVMDKGKFGINVPVHMSSFYDPDFLIVPMLAFDKNGYRLGYGKGFYDRTLASLKHIKNIQTVGLAFSCQYSEIIPHQGHDEPLNWIITDEKINKIK
ncbi:MAG: 5-formyltetrahydrofolate cyclo-ligase [Alphaproteobacteria bacterium]|nr:5-formyltetrahydrofolate cyclo-ligase [Alphaproteobacteria bacterium]